MSGEVVLPGVRTRYRWQSRLVDLALISLLVTITGFSYVTVVIPLTSYTFLILIRNIVAGLDGVPDDAKEAARGMGFTPRQLLWRVEVPLAMPVIIAGIRIATVSTIALVTIAALIGRGGFGQFILEGLDEFFWTPLILGSVLSVALGVLADTGLLGVQRLVTPWARAAPTAASAAPPATSWPTKGTPEASTRS